MRIVIGLAVVLLLVYVLAEWTGRRAQRRRAASPVNELLGDTPADARAAEHYGPVPRGLIVLTAGAAVAGLLAAAYGAANADDSQARDRSDQAQANRQTCLSTVNTGWRKAVGVTLVGAQVDTDEVIAGQLPTDVRILTDRIDLPTTLEGIRAEGRRRTIAALLDDARIGSTVDEICPFTPGDPARTPAKPVRSATAQLERELEQTNPGD